MRVLIFVCGLLLSNLVSADPVELDKLVKQWVQLEQQTSELTGNWRQRKPILEQQLTLLAAEKDSLTKLLGQDTDNSDEIKQQRFELIEKQTTLEAGQNAIELMLSKTEQIIKTMYPQLPPPLKQMWDNEIALLSGLQSNSEKLEKQLFMLDSVNRYNRRLAAHKTSMVFANDLEVQVQQIFLGTSIGWYVSQDGQFWGNGRSTASGWQWQHQPENITATELQDLIFAVENINQAKLISLPIVTTSR